MAEFPSVHSVLDRSSPVGVIGAGTMGSGIAQLAAMHGHKVVLFDSSSEALARAQTQFGRVFARLAEKGTLTSLEAEEIKKKIVLGQNLRSFAHCKLVVEAIIERIEDKQELFTQLETIVPETCVLATNTSSLSVTALASSCRRSGRVLGLHFFNPAPVMALVELVPWAGTTEEALLAVEHLVRGWGKTIIRASDTPGFIVNRVARPFYLEALRMLDEGVADCATIDWAMREIGGFRMGPFELMDLIGLDVNLRVSESVFEAFYYEPRFRPSLTQKRLVDGGFLGKKAGRGFYDHSLQAKAPSALQDKELGARIFERILACLINEACEALQQKVASAEDIDRAVTLGLNYPKGLLSWCDEFGAARVVKILEGLALECGSDTYRACKLLSTVARAGTKFFP